MGYLSTPPAADWPVTQRLSHPRQPAEQRISPCRPVPGKGKHAATYRLDEAIGFEVVDNGERKLAWYGKEPGVVQPGLKWTTEYTDGRPERSPTEFLR